MANLNTPTNQTLALAGLLQATYLCKNLATYGRADVDHLSASLESILKIDSDDVETVYGGVASVTKGLRLVGQQLGGSSDMRDLDLSRYSVAVIQLGDNVLSQTETINQIQSGIKKAQSLDFHILDETMINNLANIYRNCISHLSPRIMISGQPEYLNNEQTAAKIRAALLAGLRSVVLWRQCGGTRPGLLLGRNKYLRTAEGLLKGKS